MDAKENNSEIRNKMISKDLSAFGFGQIQDAMNIFSTLKAKEIELETFMSWVSYMKLHTTRSIHEIEHSGERDNNVFRCPLCSMPLRIFPVNTTACDNVGGNSKSVMLCYDELSCGYELYSDEDIEYWKSLSNNFTEMQTGAQPVKDEKSNCNSCGG